MKSWLIQRGRFNTEKKENINGIDSLVSFDYMGSSEFEWGSLPKSLNKIIEQWNNFEAVGTGIKDKNNQELFVLCNKNSQDEVTECVKWVSKHSYGYKEHCDMKGHLEKDKYARNDFWWDIENLWMALCIKKENGFTESGN